MQAGLGPARVDECDGVIDGIGLGVRFVHRHLSVHRVGAPLESQGLAR